MDDQNLYRSESPDRKKKGLKKFSCLGNMSSSEQPLRREKYRPSEMEEQETQKVNPGGNNFNSRRENKIDGLSMMPYVKPDPTACLKSMNQTHKILEDLNIIFQDRLDSIDCLAEGNIDLKFLTYQEWVDMLLAVTKDLFDSVKKLELQSGERITALERKLANCIEVDCGIKVESLKHDRDNLLEIIHRAVKENRWNIEGLSFTTIEHRDIFGLSSDISFDKEINPTSESPACRHAKQKKTLKELKEVLLEKENQIKKQNAENEHLKAQICTLQKQIKQNEKISSNIKALAVEVADKYDEIREMRKQIFALEEEILNAQKKIQLKDDVIKELRSDLKALVKFDCCKRDFTFDMSSTSGSTTPVPCTNLKVGQFGIDAQQTTNDANNEFNSSACLNAVSAFDPKSYDELIELESQYLKTLKTDEQKYMCVLKNELNSLVTRQQNYVENVDDHKRILNTQQEKITNIVQSLLDKLKEAETRLNYLRENLLSVSFDNAKCISKWGTNLSLSDLAVENRIVTTVRNRIKQLEEENSCLRSQIQQLNMSMTDAKSMVDSKVQIIEKNTCVLKDVASALSNVCSQDIPYQNFIPSSFLPKESESSNTFSEAIYSLGETLKKKNDDLAKMRFEICELKNSLKSKNDETNCLKANYEEEIYSKQELVNTITKENADLKKENLYIKEKETSSEFIKLLDSKNYFQSECNNQLLVIKNLREALEACRRDNSVGNASLLSSSSISNSNHNSNQATSSSGSIWTWWKDNVHNV